MLSKLKNKLKTNEAKNWQKLRTACLKSKFPDSYKKSMKWFLKKSESTARSFRNYNTVYKREQNSKLFAYCSQTVKSSRTIVFRNRGGVEDTRLEAKAKDTKKSEAKAKDSLSEDRPSRGQGQECSRPRTKDTAASVFQKKTGFQKSFSGDLQFLGLPRIFDWGGLNHKSHAMTSSKFFQKGSTRVQKYRMTEGLKSLVAGK